MFVKHDVTSLADWTKLVELTEEKFGPVSILVNNAVYSGQLLKPQTLPKLIIREYAASISTLFPMV